MTYHYSPGNFGVGAVSELLCKELRDTRANSIVMLLLDLGVVPEIAGNIFLPLRLLLPFVFLFFL